MENSFGTESRLSITAGRRGEKTVLEDCFFRAPFKIMKPFCPEGTEGMELMIMSVSAGILAGDSQEIQIEVKKGARLFLTTQSFEKVHKMEPGGRAFRNSRIRVENGGFLSYQPLPVIPFAGADFSGDTQILLEGPEAGLIYSEILSCGRAARGERFLYRRYQNRILVSCGDVPLYADNTIYLPRRQGMEEKKEEGGLSFMDMEETGFYEGHTHLANLILLNLNLPENFINRVREILEEAGKRGIQGGVTETGSDGFAVKILGNQAQSLSYLLEEIRDIALGR